MKIELSAYRLMWMFVIFDLPVIEVKDRKDATKFRNFLLDQGFEMIQFSVYARLMSGKDAIEAYVKRIKINLPLNGSVKIICITDKQYENIISFESSKEIKKKMESNQPLLF